MSTAPKPRRASLLRSLREALEAAEDAAKKQRWGWLHPKVFGCGYRAHPLYTCENETKERGAKLQGHKDTCWDKLHGQIERHSCTAFAASQKTANLARALLALLETSQFPDARRLSAELAALEEEFSDGEAWRSWVGLVKESLPLLEGFAPPPPAPKAPPRPVDVIPAAQPLGPRTLVPVPPKPKEIPMQAAKVAKDPQPKKPRPTKAPQARPTPEDIEAAVFKEYGFTREQIQNGGKVAVLIEPRWVLWHLLREVGGLSAPAIGLRYQCHPDTIHHARRHFTEHHSPARLAKLKDLLRKKESPMEETGTVVTTITPSLAEPPLSMPAFSERAELKARLDQEVAENQRLTQRCRAAEDQLSRVEHERDKLKRVGDDGWGRAGFLEKEVEELKGERAYLEGRCLELDEARKAALDASNNEWEAREAREDHEKRLLLEEIAALKEERDKSLAEAQKAEEARTLDWQAACRRIDQLTAEVGALTLRLESAEAERASSRKEAEDIAYLKAEARARESRIAALTHERDLLFYALDLAREAEERAQGREVVGE